MASSELQADDGRQIPVQTWQSTDRKPKAVVQLLHGLGEYAERYARFANACNESGIVLVAHDHRGHGKSPALAGHYDDQQGWDKVISDALVVQTHTQNQFPGVPLAVLGHSMGSYIAQSLVMRHPDAISMLVLSASTFRPGAELRVGNFLASLLARFGKRKKSDFLNSLGLDAFNKPFEPSRTPFDWLSRDTSEVDKYIADPLCGGQFSNQFWRDLTGGLIEISSLASIAKVPTDIPILILGGQHDPVGGEKGLTRLADAYRRTGHDELTLRIYEGGRHEMLNETNRDEVTGDIIGWIGGQL